MKRRLIQITLFLIILAMALSACSSNDNNHSSGEAAETGDSDRIDLVVAPTEEYILSCLENTPNILEVATVTEENDPNGELNSTHGYYSAIFFSVDLLNQSEVSGDDFIDAGTDVGGCIEAYKTEADAQSRNDYLSGYDDNWLLNAGYHTVIGTLVIRTSHNLSENVQTQLESNIINVLTGNLDDVTVLTDIQEKKDEEVSSSVISADNGQEHPVGKITMLQGASEYLGAEWTVSSLTEYFKEMGFTNIRTIPCEPDDDNYENNIFGYILKRVCLAPILGKLETNLNRMQK